MERCLHLDALFLHTDISDVVEVACRAERYHLEILIVVIETREICSKPPIEPFRLKTDLIGVHLLRVICAYSSTETATVDATATICLREAEIDEFLRIQTIFRAPLERCIAEIRFILRDRARKRILARQVFGVRGIADAAGEIPLIGDLVGGLSEGRIAVCPLAGATHRVKRCGRR